MSFIADTQTKLDTVANKIKQINPSAANRLFRLSAAVGRAPNSMYEAWSLNDIHQMVGIHAITEQLRARDIPNQGLRFLEWTRNLLIFLPLVLTWYGISNAVSSYNTFITVAKNGSPTAQQQLTLPFLYLWQQRFGGYLPGWLTLGNLAFYDFLLLLLLVILTAIVNVRTHLRTNHKEQEAELLQEELTDALSDAALCLTRPPTTGQAGGVGVIDIRQQLEQLRDEVVKDRESRDAALQNATALIQPLAPLLQTIITGAQQIQHSMDALAQALPNSMSGLGQTLQNLLGGVQQLENSMNGLGQTLQNLSGTAQQLVNNQTQLLVDVGNLLTAQENGAGSVRQLVEDQRAWGQAIMKAVQNFTTISQGLSQMPAAVKQWSTQLEALVNQLTIEHQAQVTVTQQITDAAAHLKNAFDQVERVAADLGGIAHHFFDIRNMMENFPGFVNGSIGEVARRYGNAADSVVQGGNNLSYAAKVLYDAANRLNGK